MNPMLIDALAGALLHFVWEGAALAMILALVLLAFRGAKARYGAACVALFAMPVAFLVTLALLLPHTTTFAASLRWPPTAGLLPSASAVLKPESLMERLRHASRGFVPIWFAGMVLLYLRNAGSWIGVLRLRRTGVSAAPAEWQKRVCELASGLGIGGAVRLLESHVVDVPVVAGFLRPVILIPAGFLAGMPPEQLEYLLIHELAHVRRLDYFVNLLQKTIEGLLFYHPAVWWISSVIAKERENCCDDVVLSVHPEPGRYASALAALEHSRWSAMPAANGGSLSQRIRRILNRPEKPHLAQTPVLAALLLAVSAAVALAALQNPAPALPADAQAQSADPFDRWLREDVLYIITDEERRAFKNLQSNEERANFIEQFWQRRDPTPGTPENEMKDEHYRRIAYANTHFTSSTVPGWHTDRGRIYITFGPPDEIDAHPSCSATQPSLENWKYRWIEGIGNNVSIDFIDASCNGEYHMTMDPNEQGAEFRGRGTSRK